MIWRISFVALLLGSILVACGDRDMTPEEITELLEAPAVEEEPVVDDLVEGEQP